MEKYQQIIAVESDVTIVVRAHGNLDVHQWDRPELGLRRATANLRLGR